MTTSTHAFRRGAVLGSVVASFLALVATFMGNRTLRKKTEAVFDEYYQAIRRRIGAVRELTEEKYAELVEKIADEYAEKRAWAAVRTKALARELKKRWFAFQVFYLLTEIKAEIGAHRFNRADYFDVIDTMVDSYTAGKAAAKQLKRDLTAALRERWEEFKESVIDASED